MKTVEEKKIKIHQEALQVSKEKYVKAVYDFKKTTEEQQVPYFISLMDESVEVEEKMIDEEITEYPETRIENDTTIIPVIKEVEVLTKKIILVKEVHIKKKIKTTIEKVATNRKTEKIQISKRKL